jgi:hypothetical protein
MKTSTRTLRLIAATAAALVLMTAVAQARPIAAAPANGATSQTATGLAPDRVDKVGTTAQRGLGAPVGSDTVVLHTSSGNGGFDWTAAGIGAGTAFGLVLIVGAAGMSVRGRRGVALSS